MNSHKIIPNRISYSSKAKISLNQNKPMKTFSSIENPKLNLINENLFLKEKLNNKEKELSIKNSEIFELKEMIRNLENENKKLKQENISKQN